MKGIKEVPVICDDVIVGIGASIIGNVIVWKGSVVGSGAVATKNVIEKAVVTGIQVENGDTREKKMNILIITDVIFPYGVAMASRIRSFCKLFKKNGYSVHVISAYTKCESDCEIHSIDGYTCQAAVNRQPNSKDSFIGIDSFISLVEEYLNLNKVDAVLMTSCPVYFNRIHKLVSHKNVPLFIEQCEWYDISSYRFKWFDYRYWNDNYLKKYGYRRANGVFAISRLLESHYKKLNVNVTRIPTILDVENMDYSINKLHERLIIIYTGSLGKSKELVAPIIRVLAEEKDLSKKIQFHIYGPSKEDVLKSIGKNSALLQEASDSVVIHGRVPQEEIHNVIMNADFQIFIRPNRMSSNAGFPTKLGESMAAGTPVITNNTGDIGLYLKSGLNGFTLESITKEAVVAVFQQMLKMSMEEYVLMRKNARKTAERSFDYRNFEDNIKKLIESEYR